MAMELWDPFSQVMSLPEAMNRLFQDSVIRPSGGLARRGTEMEGAMLPLDVHESEDSYTIQASLPGVKPEDVQIQVVGDTVTIRGETREEREEKRGQQTILRERRMGRFVRTLTLPNPVDSDHAEATFENGVLTLRLPKAREARPRRIQVRSTDGKSAQEGSTQSTTQARQQGQRHDQATSMGRPGSEQGSGQTQSAGASS